MSKNKFVLSSLLCSYSQVTDLPDELCFSAFHRKDGQEIRYERKTDDEYEASAIIDLFRGQTLTLGEIKKKITLETPFVFHSRALKVCFWTGW